MIIAPSSKIPVEVDGLKKESDLKKRIGRRLDIGRLRDSQSETNLATLKKETTRRSGMVCEMGLVVENSPANRTRCSLSFSGAETAEIASTDTQSDVLVAAPQECHRVATHFATNQRLICAGSNSRDVVFGYQGTDEK